MEITVKKLTPELSDDFIDFFDNRAFTDDSPEGPCYCTRFQMTTEQEVEASRIEGDPPFGSEDFVRMIRKIARQQIASGILKGYLAYVDGISIGWCNVNDKANFPVQSANGARLHIPAEKQEKAVVCFEVAPEFRGKGIATALLQQAVIDAAAEGYTAVEGYPCKRSKRYEWDFNGPIPLYEKTGFVKASENGGTLVMRKKLK